MRAHVAGLREIPNPKTFGWKTGSKRLQRKSRYRQKDNIKVDGIIVEESKFGLDSSCSGKGWRKTSGQGDEEDSMKKEIISSQAKKKFFKEEPYIFMNTPSFELGT